MLKIGMVWLTSLGQRMQEDALLVMCLSKGKLESKNPLKSLMVLTGKSSFPIR